MDVEVLKSYLVGLGFQVNQPQLRRFDMALKDAARAVESRTSGVVADVLKWQLAITSAFVSVSGGVLAMAEHVAMADQKYRLLGERMFMTTEKARKLQLGMDTLGASLEQIAWDPELHANFLRLAADQDTMTQSLGSSFESNMRSLRDLRFEFSRLKLAFEFLSMAFINATFERFGLTIETAKAKLAEFTSWFQQHLPDISSKLADVFVPVLKDTWVILTSLGQAVGAFATAFTNLAGLLSGDTSVQGTSFDIEKLGKVIVGVADFFADFAIYASNAEQEVMHLINSLILLFSGKWREAGSELKLALGAAPEHMSEQRDHQGKGEAKAFLAQKPAPDEAPPIPQWPGSKASEKPAGTDVVKQQITVEAPQWPGSQASEKPAPRTEQVKQQIADKAQTVGLDPKLALAIAQRESGFRQYDKEGNVLANPGSSARGLFQLLRDTARDMKVDRNDPTQNIDGGVRYLKTLMDKYGDQNKAIAAYYWGQGNLDKAIARHQQLPPDVAAYVRGVQRNEAQNITVGDIHIAINQPGASHKEIQHAATRGVTEALTRQSQRNLAQLAYVR